MKSKRLQKKEELANGLTHGFGFILSLAGLWLLLVEAAGADDIRWIGCAIFGTTLVLLYLASTLYHTCREPDRKKFFRTLDHSAIYLLIAGTYTPFTLVFLRNGPGPFLLKIVWSLAAAGIVFKLFFTHRFRVASTLIYLFMGWLVLWEADAAFSAIPSGALYWIAGGGVAYSLGTIFYLWQRLPYHHAIWHLFVLTGSVCHYTAVYLFVL